MKRRTGFTLVELLAVIVILAIVLIIAVPGVLFIINQTKDNALDRQKDMIKEASRLYVTSESDVLWVGQDTKMTTVALDVLKAKGYLDQKIVDPKTKKEISCAKTTIKKIGSKYDYEVQLCDQMNASPRLSSNMIPIRYDGSTWVKADYTNQDHNWYDYDNQQWANMATVSESTRDAYKKADIGTEVKMEDINTMFVWIPRFKYKLFNVSGTVSPVGNSNLAGDYMIDVQLEDAKISKSKGTQNGQWLTHPAFTFGGQELEGFWMAKFETGYAGATTKVVAEQNVVDASKVVIKPGVYSWRGIQTSKLYENSFAMRNEEALFGITKVEDPHMVKNMEWGAMAYLTYSQYGKAGNANYVGVEKQVRSNSFQDHMTGCGADAQDAAVTDVCHTYETVNGQAASTTGNITGIYDTAGGTWEAVATVMADATGEHGVVASSGFEQSKLDELVKQGVYIELYAYGVDDSFSQFLQGDFSRGKLGEATLEMGPFALVGKTASAWYQDQMYLPTALYNSVWIFRGSNASVTPSTLVGILAMTNGVGDVAVNVTSRVVLV